MRSDSPTSTERRITAWVFSAAGAATLSASIGIRGARPRRARGSPGAAAPRRSASERTASRRYTWSGGPPAGSTTQRVASRRPSPSSSSSTPPSTDAEQRRCARAAATAAPRRRPRARPPSASRPRASRARALRRPCARTRARSRRAARRTRPTRAARDCGAGSWCAPRDRRARCRAARAARPDSGRSRTDRHGGCVRPAPTLRSGSLRHAARVRTCAQRSQCRRLRYSCDFFAHWLSGARATDVRQVAHRLAALAERHVDLGDAGSSPRTPPPRPGSGR